MECCIISCDDVILFCNHTFRLIWTPSHYWSNKGSPYVNVVCGGECFDRGSNDICLCDCGIVKQ